MTSFIHSLVTEKHSPTLFASAFNRGACTRHTPAESTLSQHLEHKTPSFPSLRFCWEQGRDIGQVAPDPCRCQVPEERESRSAEGAAPVLAGGKRAARQTALFPAPKHAKTRLEYSHWQKAALSFMLIDALLPWCEGVLGTYPTLPAPCPEPEPMPATPKVQQHHGAGTGWTTAAARCAALL